MKKSILYIMLAASTLMACENIVEGLNENPNNPTNASADLLLTGLQLANLSFQEGLPARTAGIWSGYLTGADREYKDIQNYTTTGSIFNTSWQLIYYGVLQQEKLLEERARPLNNRLMIGIARVSKAHAVATATSLWGDIPYYQVNDIEKYPNPAFDSQVKVLAEAQTLLDSAITDLQSGIGSVGVADIHFGGRAASWIAVAHTLKARLFLLTRNYDKAYAEAVLGIASASNSLLAPHTTVAGTQNFYSYGHTISDVTSENAYITTLLDPANPAYKGNAKTDERSRLNYYFTFTESGGVKTKFKFNYTGTASLKGIFAQAASYSLVTYQENLLILAEAGFRTKGFDEGLKNLNAYRAYLNGGGYIDPTYRVAGTLKYEPYVAGDFDANGIANKSSVAKEKALLKEILVERYVTFFGQTLGFDDIRRTRKEAEGVKVPANFGSILPERFVYSQDEINSNSSVPSPLPGVFDPTPINK